MNLEDVIDPEYGLQQDEWSLTKPTFGEEGQLEVVGWSGKRNGRKDKKYIVKCNKCSQDMQLFGGGYFTCYSHDLKRGQIPCGCSKKHHWSKEQYATLCSRKAEEMGHTFVRFSGEWMGVRTKIIMMCEKHGEWGSTTINRLVNSGQSCPDCGKDVLKTEINQGTWLQQDQWTLKEPKFGDTGQLRVVGWAGRCGNNKKYILRCDFCSKDSELFGDGYFTSTKGRLESGNIPCGCSKKPSWSEKQYEILCQRKAEELGYKFLGFVGDFIGGSHHRVILSCQKHGEWSTNTVNNLRRGQGCPDCGKESTRSSSLKSDESIIQSFFTSGGFHKDTKFWRSGRRDSRGWQAYWDVFCPDCGQTANGYMGNLLRGQRPCACSKQRQQEAYINLIMEEDNTIAIKFGIARDSGGRVKRQSSKSIYTLKQHNVFSFPSVEQCKAAERECKQTLECGVVLKRDMPDGYTETTWLYNLDKIKQIYEKHGGVPV